MDANELKDKIADILKYECSEIDYKEVGDMLRINLDCYAISGGSMKKIIELGEDKRGCVFTTQSVQNPKIQIFLSI